VLSVFVEALADEAKQGGFELQLLPRRVGDLPGLVARPIFVRV
jgi:hypothetical protein